VRNQGNQGRKPPAITGRSAPAAGLKKRAVNRIGSGPAAARGSLGTRRYHGGIIEREDRQNPARLFSSGPRQHAWPADQKGLTMFILEVIGAVLIALSLCALLSQDAGMSR
jgi:hypothetical protein